VKALNQPESWWGWHGWNQPEPLSITQILASGTMTTRIAAMLWLAMERGVSMVFAADPPGAGKTTILTALLAFARPDASLYFTRGWGEQFRLPPPPSHDEPPIYLMVNEMSDHLPVYSWGPYVVKAFELAADGYTLLTTMHAETVEGVVEQLTDENDVPERLVGHMGLVVPMFVGAREGRRIRRVSEVAVLEPLGPGYDRHTVAQWSRDDDAWSLMSTPAEINALARRMGIDEDELMLELAKREGFLQHLLDSGVMEMEDVQRRVFEHSGYTVLEESGSD
jgi:hypothetical protein